MESEIHRLIVGRDRKFTNFVEVHLFSFSSFSSSSSSFQWQNVKLIYRRYAGLYFTLGVDVDENELLMMETIHFFVELLDTFFQNVCELDIVFNFNKVYMILDEYILAGEVQETSRNTILERVRSLDRLD